MGYIFGVEWLRNTLIINIYRFALWLKWGTMAVRVLLLGCLEVGFTSFFAVKPFFL